MKPIPTKESSDRTGVPTMPKKRAPRSAGTGKVTGGSAPAAQVVRNQRLRLWAPPLIALLLAVVPFAYGKYLEFGNKDPFDGGMNVYTAQSIVNGGRVGVDVFPSARPATLLVNVVGTAVFGFSELGPKLIQMFMQIGALVLMFCTLRRLYGATPAIVAVFLAAFYLSCPPFAKYGNVKEQFMIACMIGSACGLILRHLGGSWWYLVLSGALAINIYFFKPTGASVMIAMAVYLVAQPILRRRSWRDFGQDVGGLLFGAVIGLLPLVIFQLWQGRLTTFLASFPGIKQLIRQLRSSSGGGGGSGGNTALGGTYVASSREATSLSSVYNTVVGYYRWLVVPIGLSLTALGWWMVRVIMAVAARLTHRPSTTSDQQPNPVGQRGGLPDTHNTTATIKRGQIDSDSEPADNPLADRIVLLLGLWWILDMLFVWVSPRSYVQYFLPLNGSAAMLAGYVVYRCLRNRGGWGYVAVLAVWLAIEWFVVWVKPGEGAALLQLRENGPDGFWSGYSWRLAAFAATLLLCIAWRVVLGRGQPSRGTGKSHSLRLLVSARRGRVVRDTILALLAVALIVGLNQRNAKAFSAKVSERQQQRAEGGVPEWEQIGRWIRDNSQPDDGLYVWGWFPGIYVEAQRFAPVKYPAESNMHTMSPKSLQRRTVRLVEQLQAEPSRFIVDSQKMHFPYYAHPVFDLWPRLRQVGERPTFDLRLEPRSVKHASYAYMTFPQWEQSRASMLTQVERLTVALWTNPKRRYGPVDPEDAQAKAAIEKERHIAMEPLRQFVMTNYKPIKPAGSSMFVFEYVGEAAH